MQTDCKDVVCYLLGVCCFFGDRYSCKENTIKKHVRRVAANRKKKIFERVALLIDTCSEIFATKTD